MKIYFLPGLGFDTRIFKKLELRPYEPRRINWIEPHGNEPIGDYANRMSVMIKEKEEEVVLIGHSFGGIISQEIARLRKIRKVILISSIRSRAENPVHFKMIHPLLLHKLFTKSLVLKTIKYWGKQYGYEAEEEQDFVKAMIRGHSDQYLQWALSQLSTWDLPPCSNETEIIQIHGDADQTFPLKWIKHPDYVIPGGGHFMVYQQPGRVSEIILDSIKGRK